MNSPMSDAEASDFYADPANQGVAPGSAVHPPRPKALGGSIPIRIPAKLGRGHQATGRCGWCDRERVGAPGRGRRIEAPAGDRDATSRRGRRARAPGSPVAGFGLNRSLIAVNVRIVSVLGLAAWLAA